MALPADVPLDRRLPRPAAVLRIGVVGHSWLTDLESKAIQSRLRQVLDDVVDEAQRCFAESSDLYDAACEPRIRLVTSLAPGVDQLAVEWAIARGSPVERRHFLPRPADEYEKAIAVHPVGPFVASGAPQRAATFLRNELAGRHAGSAGVRVVTVALEPSQIDCGSHDLELPLDANSVVARMVVDASDILVAVWCGAAAAARDARGHVTQHALKRARQRGIPTVVLDLAGSPPSSGDRDSVMRGLRRTISPYGPAGTPPAESSRRARSASVARWVVRQLLPPKYHAPTTGSRDASSAQRSEQRATLRQLTTTGSGRTARQLGACWRALWSYVREHAAEWRDHDVPLRERPPRVASPPALPVPGRPAESLQHEELERFVTRQRSIDDRLAIPAMDRYRGAFVAVFALGVVAIFAAVAAYGCKRWSDGSAGDEALAASCLAVTATTVEVLVLSLAGFLHFRNQREKWHQHAVDLRRLVEMLRHSWPLRLVGVALPLPAEEPHRTALDAPPPWYLWHYAASERAFDFGAPLGSPAPLVIDRSYLVDAARFLARGSLALPQLGRGVDEAWISSQRAYHPSNWLRLTWLHHFAERWIARLFLVVWLLALGCALYGWIASFAGPPHPHGPEWWRWRHLFLLIATVVPACIAALHGLLTHGEFEHHAKSSELLRHHLSGIDAQLRRQEEEPSLRELQDVAGAAAVAMLNEVEAWHTTYGSHSIPLP